MLQPDEFTLAPCADGSDYTGKFRCPECGQVVYAKAGQRWTLSSRDTDSRGDPVPDEHAWVTDLSPSVDIAGDHPRKYPFSQRGETCPGWHGWWRDGRWVAA